MNKLVSILFTCSMLLASNSVTASLIKKEDSKSKYVITESLKSNKYSKNHDDKSDKYNNDHDGKNDKSNKNHDEKSNRYNKDYDEKSDKFNKDHDEKSDKSNKEHDEKNDKSNKNHDENSDNAKTSDASSNVKKESYIQIGNVKVYSSDDHAFSLFETLNIQDGILDNNSFNYHFNRSSKHEYLPNIDSDFSNILNMHFSYHITKKGKKQNYASVTEGAIQRIKTKYLKGSLQFVKLKYFKEPKKSNYYELLALENETTGNQTYNISTAVQSTNAAQAVSEPSSIIIILLGCILLFARKKLS